MIRCTTAGDDEPLWNDDAKNSVGRSRGGAIMNDGNQHQQIL